MEIIDYSKVGLPTDEDIYNIEFSMNPYFFGPNLEGADKVGCYQQGFMDAARWLRGVAYEQINKLTEQGPSGDETFYKEIAYHSWVSTFHVGDFYEGMRSDFNKLWEERKEYILNNIRKNGWDEKDFGI